jgi:hypothetical protein
VEDLVPARSYYKNSSHYGLLSFLTALRIYGSSYGSSSFDFCMTTHLRVGLVGKVEGNRTACRCHDIQFSEQRCNSYGTIDRIPANKHSTLPVAFWSRNKAGTWSQARLHTLTTVSTSFVMSIQSRPSVSFRDTCFAVHHFLFPFPCFFAWFLILWKRGWTGMLIWG